MNIERLYFEMRVSRLIFGCHVLPRLLLLLLRLSQRHLQAPAAADLWHKGAKSLES